ncbi:MAG: helix-turn-helix domain-containing protein [Gammaproteobacteria bacterium]
MQKKQKSQSEARPIRGAELSRSIGMSHLSWSFDPASAHELTGEVTSRAIGALRISWIRLGLGLNTWSGERTSTDISSQPEPYLIFVMPLQGSIRLTAPGKITDIGQNDIGIWDSTQPFCFELKRGTYEQISVLVPQRVLRTRPEVCAELHCAHVDETNVLSELCVQHMTTLAKFLNSQLRPYEISLSTLTTSTFDAVLSSLYKVPRDRDFLLDEIKNYIECYITDESLSPKTVATAFEISTRYAHKLFERSDCTLGEWILNRRLERSATDLASNEQAVTDVAYKWGFKDLGHYSRTFKKRFGETPSAFRKNAMRQSGQAQ